VLFIVTGKIPDHSKSQRVKVVLDAADLAGGAPKE
jgi:hypothetical protein